jgi:hypothetical protein
MMIMLWKVYFCYDEKQHEVNESPGWNWLLVGMKLSGYSGAISMSQLV